ncbi:MAG: dockerin type I repeat-containing protein [Clostridia bacterium]|nr:dockerin type I repeat-containing protein [Clostridia bacterium]
MKRTISIVLALLMLMSMTVFVVAVQNAKLGDINADGTIDQVDYLLVKRYCFNTFSLDSEQTFRADVNRDDAIDQLDYLLIKRHCFNTYKIPEISEPEVIIPDWLKPNEVTTVTNLTKGNSYTANLTPYGSYLDESGKDLTNGVIITHEDNQTTSPYADSRWVGYTVGKGQLEVVLPLGDGNSIYELQRVEVNIGCDKLDAGITEPNIDVYYTEDGTNYKKFGSYSRTGVDKFAVTAVVDPGASVKATAIKVVAKPALSGKTLVWLGEVTAYGIAPTELTQVAAHETENFLSDSTFSMFLNNAVRFAVIPGLEQDIVPQGLARNPETGYVYISAYYNSGDKPSVIIVLDPNGKFVAEYFVYRSNGNAYTGHMGGICVTEEYLYFTGPTDSQGNYTVAEFELAHLPLTGSHKITIHNTVAMPIHSSFLFYDSGILWSGTFYIHGNSSYGLGKLFNTNTTSNDGKTYGGYAAAFVLDGEEKRLAVDATKGYAVPDTVLSIPDKVQGFAYKDGKVALSISYGRNNNSTLEFYNIDLAKANKSITVDNSVYPMIILDSLNRKKTVTTMCMTEGLTLAEDGNILVLYESGAQKYYNSKNPTDYIWDFVFLN